MEIKYKVGDKVYVYGNRNILETKVTKIEVTENGVKYGVIGEYHHKRQDDLFPKINLLLKDLETRVIIAKPLKDRTNNAIGEARNKVAGFFKKNE